MSSPRPSAGERLAAAPSVAGDDRRGLTVVQLNPNVLRWTCSSSGQELPKEPQGPVGLCPCCPAPGKPVLVQYDLDRVREQLDAVPFDRQPGPGIWRYAPLLPVQGVSAAYAGDVGRTPLVEVPSLSKALDLRLRTKCEGSNPSGSFKDRGLSVGLALGYALGARRFCLPTQGNAGVAAALFSSRLGIEPCRLMMPEGHRGGTYARAARHFGAEVGFTGANIAAAGKALREELREELDSKRVVDVSTFFEPGRLEGKKTMGLELFEDTGAEGLPDWLIYPTGGGTGLVGIWKAFAELRGLGLLGEGPLPRMVAVQSDRCAPVVAAFESGAEQVTPITSEGTIATGLDVPGAIMGHGILSALRESGGTAVAVSEQSIRAAFERLGRAGVPSGYEGAATLAALEHLRAAGTITAGASVVLLITSGPTADLEPKR